MRKLIVTICLAVALFFGGSPAVQAELGWCEDCTEGR